MYKIVTNEKVEIEKLVPGGQGLGTVADGRKGFFWNVLPGEIVTEYEIFKRKAKYVEAVALKIENDSKWRVAPRDDIYLSTAPWQIMDYSYELDWKMRLLRESFRQEGLECIAKRVQTDGKQFHYRNKMEYSLYWDVEEERIKLAFRKRGTHRKVPIKTSSLERPEIYEKAVTVINDLNTRGEEAYKYQSLLLRANQQGTVAGGLYENHRPHPKFAVLTDVILGRKYNYSPNGFFQINIPVYEMALREITEHIQTRKVLDLYAGVGTIGLSVARDKELTLVEVNKEAFFELKNNCEAMRNDSGVIAKAVLAKAEEVLDYIEAEMTVIVDPPRAGCEKKLIERMIEVQPERIIYLSCNPATQARDLKWLSEVYEIEKVVPFNFFPRTPHLENLTILTRR